MRIPKPQTQVTAALKRMQAVPDEELAKLKLELAVKEFGEPTLKQ